MASLLSKNFPVSKFAAAISRPAKRSLSSLKEAYVYHPKQETLEADLQALLWTKTQTLDKYPQSFTQVRNGLELDRFQSLISPTILSSRVYEMKEVKMKHKNKPRDRTNGSHKNFPISLMLNLFKMSLTHAAEYPHLHNLHLSLEPFISAGWSCGEDRMTVRGKVDMVLNTQQPLEQFYNTETIQRSMDFDFNSLQNTLTFADLKKHQVNNTFSTGAVDTSPAHYPHAHTLIVLDNGSYIEPPSKGVPEIQLVQKGLIFTFGRLYAQAVSKYGEEMIGQDLPTPECAQCIVTNGQRFSFLWYQLNTLKTDSLNEGVKNLVYIDRAGMLYPSVESKGVFKKSIADMNNHVLRTLISMFIA